MQYGPDLVNDRSNAERFSRVEDAACWTKGWIAAGEPVNAISRTAAPQGQGTEATSRAGTSTFATSTSQRWDYCAGQATCTRHPDFIANFKSCTRRLGDFAKESIQQYIDDLETAEIERMLADDEARRLR
ncbi:MAG: hypothetical protein U0694_07675 [Anaerolineae bacterium]